MRKIKIGAIQPQDAITDASCYPFQPTYRNDISYLMENQVKPSLDVTLRLLEEAGQAGLDIVTTCEDSCALSAYFADETEQNVFPALAEASATYAEEQYAALAKRYHMYIVACYFKPFVDGVYNTAVLFDREGHITSTYRKTHLPPNELWQVKEGDALDVFETDFGKIGMLICYDMFFPEPARILSLLGAEIIFHPTFGYGWYESIGEATLRTRANDNSVYIVTSKNYRYNGAGRSSVIDPWGHILADAGYYANRLVWQEIDLDCRKTMPEWSYSTQMSGEADVATLIMMERRPDLYGTLTRPDLAKKLVAPALEKRLELSRMVQKGLIRW